LGALRLGGRSRMLAPARASDVEAAGHVRPPADVCESQCHGAGWPRRIALSPGGSAHVVAAYSNMLWSLCACVIIPGHVILTRCLASGDDGNVAPAFAVAGTMVGLLRGSQYAIGAAMVPHCATSPVIQCISPAD